MATLDVDPAPAPSEAQPTAPSGRTPMLQFAESLGLSTPAERKARTGKIETIRGDLEAAAKKEAATQELIAGDIEKGAGDVKAIGAERDEFAKTGKPPTPELKPPPSTQSRAFLEPGPSVLSQVQTILMGIGQVGMQMQGLKGGGYAIAATSAMKGMLEGWQQGDAERVKRQYTEWKANQDKLLQEHTLARETYQDILTNYKRRIDDRAGDIYVRAEAAGHRVLAQQALTKDLAGMLKTLEADRDYDLSLLQAQVKMEEYHTTQFRLQRDHDDLERQRKASNTFRREAGVRAEKRQQFREETSPVVMKLQLSEVALTQQITGADLVAEAVDRIDKKGVLPEGATFWDKVTATAAIQTYPGDKELAKDIQTVQRLGIPLLLKTEMSLGVQGSQLRVKSMIEAEAGNPTGIPKAFWDMFIPMAKKKFAAERTIAREHLQRIDRLQPAGVEAEPGWTAEPVPE